MEFGIMDYSHAAQLQAEYERERYGDLPCCDVCGNEFDPDDLVNGVCENCAEKAFTIAEGREFINENFNEWMAYIDGEDMDDCTVAQYAKFLMDFCLREMKDEWRKWIYV